MKLKHFVLTVGIFFLGSISLLAQTGAIRVTVLDDKTGETLIGANIVIDGTLKGTITDLDGVGLLTGIQPGTYNLRVSYISYDPILVKDVKVNGKDVTSLNIRLKSSDLKIGEVVVTAKAVKSSESALLTIQRKSPKVFDAITADQFSRSGVSDAASALKRVTGVTVEDGKYVYVRGLGDRYSKSVLNGMEVPGLDPNKNSMQLDLFPTDLIDNIIVYKTFTPDLPGDFAGGLIDINIKDFPTSFKLSASAGLGYNPQANLNNNFLVARGSSTDFLGFDNGFRSMPPVLEQYTPENFPQPYTDKEAITEVSRAFTNNQFNPGSQRQFLNHDLNFSVGNQFNLFKHQFGYIVGLTYSRKFSNYTNGTENVFEGISNGQTTLNSDLLTASNEHKSTDNVLEGLLLNTSYKLNPNNKIGLSLLANQSGSNEARYQVGYLLDSNPDSTLRLQNRVIAYTQRAFRNVQLRGEHVFGSLNNMSVAWNNSFTYSSIKQPDMRMIRNQFSIVPNTNDTLFYIGNTDKPSRFFRDLDEINNSSKIDFTLPVVFIKDYKSKIKFGGLYTYKDRSFRESIYQYSIQVDKNFNGDINTFFLDSHLGYDNGEQLNYLMSQNINDNNYDAYQRLLASYLMVETPIAENLKLTTGVRFEKTDMYLKAFSDSTGSIQTNDFLPSISFTYNLGEKSNLRLSAYRTLARPSFREFSSLSTYDFLGGYLQLGNTKLKRTLINNFDLRLEKYPKSGEYLSFSLFYKKFLNPIENAQLPRAGGSASQFQYKNVNESILYGAEFEIRKNLEDYSSVLKHFRVATNVSYVYSYVNVTPDELRAIREWDGNPKETRPMFNQAPYAFNASLNYDNDEKGWESTLSFNISGKRLVVYQIDLPSIYLQPMPDLNFMLKKKLNEKLYLSFKARNLLNKTYKEQINLGEKAYYTTKYQLGRTFSLSLKYDID